MKLKFKDQALPQTAVEAVADLFFGQERQQSAFQIFKFPQNLKPER